jgi:hypothetical protein
MDENYYATRIALSGAGIRDLGLDKNYAGEIL